MALKLRPTGLGSGIDKDRPDYAIYCGELGVGRIYETRGGPDHPAHGMERHEGALRDAEVFRLHGGQEHGAGRIAGTAHLHLGSRPPVVVEPLLVLGHPPALAVLDDHDVGRPLGERNQFHFDWLPVDRRRLRPHGDRAAGPIGLRCSHRHGLNRLGRSRLWPTPRCTEKRERVQCGRMSYG